MLAQAGSVSATEAYLTVRILWLVFFFFFAFSERKTDPNSFKLVNSNHMS